LSQFPVLSAKKVCKVFEKQGYALDHQTGSHLILRKTDPPHRRLTIPNHKEIAKGTLMAIVRQAGLTLAEFKKLL